MRSVEGGVWGVSAPENEVSSLLEPQDFASSRSITGAMRHRRKLGSALSYGLISRAIWAVVELSKSGSGELQLRLHLPVATSR